LCVFDPHVAEAQVRYELSKFDNDSRLSCAKGQPRRCDGDAHARAHAVRGVWQMSTRRATGRTRWW
jgi:hypothetical protein